VISFKNVWSDWLITRDYEVLEPFTICGNRTYYERLFYIKEIRRVLDSYLDNIKAAEKLPRQLRQNNSGD